ncbi:hypothetical protein [Actinomadura sp. CNU-125]|uniref:hypothetical protein n=1 Tax=Actinomadura sp. CNU-125 TaxID=1904961 RepID=UPI000A8B5427|nr:hypothetical protein [Actinomadura sp. CNU-125]
MRDPPGGLRRTWDLRQWWGEFIEQCWFLARVTAVPVMLIAVPLGATISLQVGTSRGSSAPRPAPARCSSPP